MLCQGRKGYYCIIIFHISRIMDIFEKSSAVDIH